MGRVLIIVVLVASSMATGVAGAEPIGRLSHPISEGVRAPADPLGSVVVVEGDHLWRISARHLGRVADDEEIARYWRRVVEANTPNLRSGDPDLIYPGEIVRLP